MKPKFLMPQLSFGAIFLLCLIVAGSCSKRADFKETSPDDNAMYNASLASKVRSQPNVIVILGDDIGYEIPTYSGGQSYQTPNLNLLASRGIQMSHCFATPNCCPSRVELLSGKYGFRNYRDWSAYDTTVNTFVNYLQDAGYATCAVGKWQLGGGDASAKRMGFDQYLLHYPFNNEKGNDDAHRYKSPSLYQNGAYLPDSVTKDKYADDMFVDYISKYIDSNKTKPFFIYYAPSLCHWPFQPTPDDPEYASFQPGNTVSNPKYFPSMVSYMDKKIGDVIRKVQSSGLANNTYILFCGDNGSPESITSQYKGRTIQGGKNHSNDYGVHVPMVIYSPQNAKAAGSVQPSIIDFSDIFKTVTDIAGISAAKLATAGILDSKSFFPYLRSTNPTDPRTWSYCYWKPDPLRAPVQDKHFVQDLTYKLYDTTYGNRFFNMMQDSSEIVPLRDADLTPEEKSIKQNFQAILNNMHN